MDPPERLKPRIKLGLPARAGMNRGASTAGRRAWPGPQLHPGIQLWVSPRARGWTVTA